MTAGTHRDIYPELEQLFEERNLRITDLGYELDLSEGEVRYEFIITQHHRRIGRELSSLISPLEGVRRIRFK